MERCYSEAVHVYGTSSLQGVLKLLHVHVITHQHPSSLVARLYIFAFVGG